MIQHISILTSDGKSLLFREYGATKIDHDLLAGFLSAFSGFFKEISQSEIKSTQTANNKYFYGLLGKLIIVVCTEMIDKNEDVMRKLGEIIKQFHEKYEEEVKEIEIEKWSGERSVFKSFIDEIDRIVLGPIKVSIIGWGGVGKTSLLKLIIGEDVNLEYIPTITADIANFEDLDDKRTVVFWDFAGQIQFTALWKSLLKGTRIALLITDSTFQNVNESKKILKDLVYKYYKDTTIIGIANKQDLPNRLTPKFVERILGIPTFGMISINPQYRVKILEILKEEIKNINKSDGLSKKEE
ncbi:MAG: GTP-binding protein [archaeon]|nr:GTP-binding protein [archaeon]